MSFTTSWHTLLDELDDLPESATLITPLSHHQFRITDVQDARVIIQFEDRDETRPLQRDQFETLYRRIEDAPDGFDLDRLPPDADPYPAVWSVHPRFEVDEDAGVITQSEAGTEFVSSDEHDRATAQLETLTDRLRATLWHRDSLNLDHASTTTQPDGGRLSNVSPPET